ncbi:type I restriction endonuclease subunit R [Mucilaginibacter pallidiroseus]|uniref:type I site-specific deoxyribonuclease n=1 Tax=Mucilaginibacter pallidiroseus TaxID=2599295 RepID=A0A563UGF5_9SPHI|nr:type I restriction endonuclease [Mucilaginibacter pallidiroseus]TWR30470.1 type I restriction endonuclease subunit R [Mucilaginibacter pallidiroseus]
MNQSPEYTFSELPAIKLFQQLGYQYWDGSGTDERTGITEIVLKDRLLKSIKRLNPWIDDDNLNKAYDKITDVQGTSLIEINQNFWELSKSARFSVKQIVRGKEEFIPVKYIEYDTERIDDNDFLIVNQLKFHGTARHSVPDLVVYVNGLPVGVIECKSPTSHNAFENAYSDLDFYQRNSEKLFYYNQICAAIWEVGGKYGAIKSPAAFYSVYRLKPYEEVAGITTEQDKLIYNLFQKQRLLDIIRHFVIFEVDEGRIIKKLPRYQQIRATNNTIQKLQGGQGGVVWHTQGSGKSITMAYVTRKLQAPEYGFDNPTVIVMTDRKDLDVQITGTFRNVGLKNVRQATSVRNLDRLLRNDYGGIITTTIQKFQEVDKDATDTPDQTEAEEERQRVEKHIKNNVLFKITKVAKDGRWEEVEREEVILEELSSKKNLYVLVDEAHRSQYGFLASFMRSVLPYAKFVAFTGTPISKEDKSTLGEFYGGDYLDVYTIKESVSDGATVELLYDEGIAKLDIKKEELDAEFNEKFGHESEEKQELLKNKGLKTYQFSTSRVNEISKHVINHFRDKIYFNGNKAILVCDGRFGAIRYKQAFEDLKAEGYHDFDTKVVVSIGSPKTDEIAEEYYKTIDWNKNHPNDLKPIWVVAPEDINAVTEDYKLPFGDVSEVEKSGKKKFDNTAILIVSDMLLTGYDAPIASCLYLDKPLKEHNLLQAIARVNRSRKGKQAGYIVDYYGISAFLIQALEIFSGDLRPDDILKNINEEYPKLELNHTKLVDFFRPLKADRHLNRDKYIDEAMRFIEPVDKRDNFKELLKHFNKSVAIVLPDVKSMKFFDDFKLYNEIKLRARNAYPDDEELKVTKDESQMLQTLIDAHLQSEGIESLLNQPISIIDKDKFKEEIMNASPATKELKMHNNLIHVIKVGLDKNPDFYKPLAERLEALLKEREDDRITQINLLKAFADIQDAIVNEHREGAAKGFVTERQIAVYNTMKTIYGELNAEAATNSLFDMIDGELGIVGWEGKGLVLHEMEKKIISILIDKVDRPTAKVKSKELVEVLKRNKDA